MLIQLIIFLFILFVINRMAKKLAAKELTKKEFIIWVILWLCLGAATLYPKTTDVVANVLGVGRGYDLAVYISIIILFYLSFRMMVKIEEIDRNLTKVVRVLAIKNADSKRQETITK